MKSTRFDLNTGCTSLQQTVRVLLCVVLLACTGKADRVDTVRNDTAALATATPATDSTHVRADTTLATPDTQHFEPSGRLLTPWDTALDSADAARSWFVLRERQTITELIPTRASVVVGARPCNDTGNMVKPTGVSGPWIAMFAEIAGLRAGAIDAAKLVDDPTRVIAEHDSATYMFRDQRFVIHSDSLANDGFRIYSDAAAGRITFVEPQAKEGGAWRVLWAGDLNRDGAPDILLQTTGPEGVRYVRLFMSGPVPSNGILAPVAMAAHNGC